MQALYERTDRIDHGRRVTQLKQFINPGDTVLDVGAGNCRFAKKVETELQAHVVGVDVTNYKDAPIEMRVFDGTHLPFEDNSFDVVMLCVVLHHCKEQDKIFSECVRCARKKVIVIEDTYSNPLERLFCMWNDYHSNIMQGYVKMLKGLVPKGVLGIPMPFTFRTVAGWHKFFERFPVRVNKSTLYSKFNKPLTLVVFELEKIETQ